MRYHTRMLLLCAGCQSGPVHLFIDAGATSPDYRFTDLAGNAWSGDTFYIGVALLEMSAVSTSRTTMMALLTLVKLTIASMLSNNLQASSRGQATLCAHHVVPQLLVHRILSVTGGGTEAFSDDISQAADGTGNVYQTNRIARHFQYSFIGLQAKSETSITYHLVIYIGMHWSAIGIMWSMKMFWQKIARIFYVSAV